VLWTLLVVLLILMIAGAPGWPYWGPEGGRYGWGPSSFLGLVLVVLLVYLLMGHPAP
jgi:hypothetical protein